MVLPLFQQNIVTQKNEEIDEVHTIFSIDQLALSCALMIELGILLFFTMTIYLESIWQ